MRVLTVRQPWARALFRGKSVENRSRNIAGDYRGPVAIHAAKTYGSYAEFHTAAKFIARNTGQLPPMVTPRGLGVILGVADLVDAHPFSLRTCGIFDETSEHPHAGCSPWAFTDGWHLVFENPRELAEQIPFKGALGLRHLDDDTTARILAQIGA